MSQGKSSADWSLVCPGAGRIDFGPATERRQPSPRVQAILDELKAKMEARKATPEGGHGQ